MNYIDLEDDSKDANFYGEEEEMDYNFDDAMSLPVYANNEPIVVPVPVVIVTKQPPANWFQRGHDQEFTIETNQPFHDYSLELLFAPHAGGTVYEPVSVTLKVGNGIRHNKANDIRLHDRHLSVRPKVDICTRKGERAFVFQLTLSSGQVVKSTPFGVKNRQPKPNTFKSDAKKVLRQVEWCRITQSCPVCNQRFDIGHLDTCALHMLLQ
jgi:hypothetical protein